jgi:Cupin
MTDTTPYLTRTPDLDLPAATRDPLTIVQQLLNLVRLNGAIFFRSDFRSPWAYTSPPIQELADALPRTPASLVLLHIIAEGRCWIAMDGVKRNLSEGDVVVMPYGDAHAFGSVEYASVEYAMQTTQLSHPA